LVYSLETDCKGFVKVRLRYTTTNPVHIRSVTLSSQFGLEGPFFEEIFVLIPQREAFPLLEAFLPMFNRLKEHKFLDESAILKDFKIVDEDLWSLAYKFPL
jgi:hypothetical protein